MKAVIYARYSSDNQREESIEGQIRECTAFAEKNDITILRHYIDRAVSAKTDNRPEFQNMIKDSGKRLFDMVIVWKLDRFARNRYDSARYKAGLKKNGVKVVSATEIISEGAEGIILESVLEGYAEYYSADLSEKVIRGMTDNALKCKFNGGTKPVGYVIDEEQHFQLDPLTAPFVLEAFKRYDEGATMTEIRDWLNDQGVKNTRGQHMSYNSVEHLLKNRRYIGEFRYRETVVPDGIPAIVPQDLFDRVQEKLAKNKKAPARHKAEDDYLLTTKLFCGYCGAYLCGESGTSRTGIVHHYYKCVSVKKKRTDCRKKSVRKEWIEDLVVNETMKMVMDDKAVEAIVSMLMALQEQDNVSLPLYEKQLAEADNAIQNLLNAIQQGILTKSTKGRLEELEAVKEELETKIACEKLAKPKVSAEFMTFWLHRFRKLDVRQKIHRKMLIDTFINAIFLYDDKMVITFNYKEGTDTITFDDLKAALNSKKTGSDLDCLTAPRRSKLHIACPGVFLQKRRSALISLLLLSPRKLKGAFAGAPFGHTFKRGASKSVQKERHPLGVFPFGFVPFCGAPPFGDFDAQGGRAGPGQCSAACGAGPKAGWMGSATVGRGREAVQQPPAPGQHVSPGGLKIPGIPGVGHVAGTAGKAQEQPQLALGVAAADALHAAQVGPVHADEQVVCPVVGTVELPGGFARAADAVLRQLAPGRGIDRVADLLRAGGGGLNVKLSFQSGLPHQVLHHEFGHGAPAYVAVANK